MTFKAITGYVRESQEAALRNVEFHEGNLYDVFAGMMTYASEKEMMAWCKEVYDRAENDYQDWLSTT